MEVRSDEKSASNPVAPLLKYIVTAIAVAMSLFHMYVAGFGPPEAMQFRGIHLMFAFALVFIPPWLAFRRAGNWRSGLLWSLAIGITAYLGAFALALWLDQPFGPILAILLVALGLIVA